MRRSTFLTIAMLRNSVPLFPLNIPILDYLGYSRLCFSADYSCFGFYKITQRRRWSNTNPPPPPPPTIHGVKYYVPNSTHVIYLSPSLLLRGVCIIYISYLSAAVNTRGLILSSGGSRLYSVGQWLLAVRYCDALHPSKTCY